MVFEYDDLRLKYIRPGVECSGNSLMHLEFPGISSMSRHSELLQKPY